MPRPSRAGSVSPTAWYANTSSGHCSTAALTWTLNAMAEQRIPLSHEIENDPLHLAAADWFVRLQSTEISLDETLAWQAWLHENPANAEAFARIEEISQTLRDVPAPAALPAALIARDRYDASIPIRDWKPRAALRWPWAVLGVAASFALIAVVFAFWRAPAEANAFETVVGENRSV